MTYPPQDPHRQPQQPGQPYPQQPPQWPPVAPGAYPLPPVVPAPPKKGISTGRLLLIIGAGFIGLCCVGGIVAAIVNPSSSTTSTTTADATTAPPKLADAVHEWYAGGGQVRVEALGAELSKVGVGGQTADVRAVRAGCVALQREVEAAQAYRPFPDVDGQKWWSATLAAVARGATDCVASVDTMSTELITRAGAEFREATADLGKFSARKKELGA